MHIHERVKVIVHVDVGFQTCMCSVTCSNTGCMLKNGGNPGVEILALKWGTGHSRLTKSRQLIEWSHEGSAKVSTLIPWAPVNLLVEWLRGFGSCRTAQECASGPSLPLKQNWMPLLLLFKNVFIYLAVSGLSCTWKALHCGMQDFLLWLLSSSGAGLRNCPAACEILVPHLGIEPMSFTLEGRVLTTGPPGKSLNWTF